MDAEKLAAHNFEKHMREAGYDTTWEECGCKELWLRRAERLIEQKRVPKSFPEN